MKCPHCNMYIDVNEHFQEILTVRNYTLDWHKRQITSPRGIINLTPVQFDLLYYLMSHADEIISPTRLLQTVWGYPEDIIDNKELVRVTICQLRKKIEINHTVSSLITTRERHGYIVLTKGENIE